MTILERPDAAPKIDADEPRTMDAAPARRFGGGRFGRGARGPTRPDGEGHGSLDLRNSWQVLAGSILIPLGLIFILIGWYGSAHARVVQQQIPYLVSGSFIGLGCMVVGGLLYWGHWLYRIYDQADLHHEEQLKVLGEIARHLGGAVAPGLSDDAGGGPDALVATTHGSVYHRTGCPVIAHHVDDLRALSAPVDLEPCGICRPD